MEILEKDIATKAVDNYAVVRKEASLALAEAVKALVARKTMQPQMAGSEDKSQGAPSTPQSEP